MEISTSIEGSKATITIKGKLTVQAAPELSSAVDGLPIAVCDLDLDLTDVTYIASAGLRALMATDKLAVMRGGRMRLIHPREDVMDALEMTGLSDVFAIER